MIKIVQDMNTISRGSQDESIPSLADDALDERM
jgi:hypothetical protein